MNKGRFGIHGGQFIPETLMNAVMDLEEAYNRYRQDPDFVAELDDSAAGIRRTAFLYCTYAEKMTRDLGGAKIYLKREDLNHTGSHKINNVLGQVLLAKSMGKTRVIAETGAGPARRGHRHRGGADGDGMRNFHGQGGYPAAGLERLPHGAAGGQGARGGERHQNPEGRGQRNHAGMGHAGWTTPIMCWAP